MEFDLKDFNWIEELDQGKESPELIQDMLEISVEKKEIEQMSLEQRTRLAHSLLAIALAYLKRRDFDQALTFLIQSRDLLEDLIQMDWIDLAEIEQDLAKSYFYLGLVHEKLHENSKSKDYYFKSLEALENVCHQENKENREQMDYLLAGCQASLAVIFAREKEMDQAFDYLEKAIALHQRLYERLKRPKIQMALAQDYFNKACLLSSREDYPKAREYIERALSLQKKLIHTLSVEDLFVSLAQSHNLAGELCAKQQQAEKALDYQLKALEIWRDLFKADPSLDHENALANTCKEAGRLFYELQDLSQSLALFQDYARLLKDLVQKDSFFENSMRLAVANHILADLYSSLDEKELALESMISSIEICEVLLERKFSPIVFRELLSGCEFAGNFYEAMGQSDKAAFYRQKAIEAQNKVLFMEAMVSEDQIREREEQIRKKREEKQKEESLKELHPDKRKLLSLGRNLLTFKEDYELCRDEHFREYKYPASENLAIEVIGAMDTLCRIYPHPDYVKALAAGYNNLAMEAGKKGALTYAQEHLDEARNLLEKLTLYEGFQPGDEEILTMLYTNSGQINQGLGDFNQAQLFYEKGLALQTREETDQQDLNAKKVSARLYSCISSLYVERHEYENARKYQLLACSDFFDLAQQSNKFRDLRELGDNLNSLALIYGKTGEKEKVFETLSQALKIWNDLSQCCYELEDIVPLAMGLDKTGDIYRLAKDYNKALQIEKEALAVLEKLQDRFEEQEMKILLGEIDRNFGQIYFDQNQIEQALEVFLRGFSNFEEGLRHDRSPVSEMLFDFADISFRIFKCYESLDQIKQGNSYLEESEILLKLAHLGFPHFFEIDSLSKDKEKMAELFENMALGKRETAYRELINRMQSKKDWKTERG